MHQQVALSFCEKLVLNAVYKYIEASGNYPKASDVRDMVCNIYQIDWETQTILTFLKRISDKGYLKPTKVASNRLYIPGMKRNDYLHLELSDMATLYCRGDVALLKSTVAVL